MATQDGPQPDAPAGPADEDRSLTARHQAADWVDHYLGDVPFEDLYRSLIRRTAEQLRLVLGPGMGRTVVADLLERLIKVGAGNVPPELEERVRDGDLTLLDDFEVGFDWQEIAVEFAHLFAFARYGYGRHVDPADSRAEIKRLLAHFQEVVANPGVRAAADPYFEWLAELTAAAEARWAVDHGEPVTPGGLAALAGTKPKTIANLLAAREIATDREGRIPAAEALRYLQRRKDFVRSTWQDPVEASDASADAEPQAALAEQVFVPVDGDGSPFLPSLARRGRDGVPRYAIGTKADPEYVEDYWEALGRLARMATPRWRRPPVSAKGGWSLVSAQEGWRRFARADLERMVEAAKQSGS